MTDIQLEDITLLIAVALMHAVQIGLNANTVAYYRRHFKVFPPEMTGPPELVRSLRCQQNDLEFAIPFQVLLWTCGVCFNQGVAAILGIAYIYYRHAYKIGYIEDPDKRIQPFYGSMRALVALLALAVVGLVTALLRQHLHIDLAAMIKKQVYPLVGLKDEL